MANAFLTPDVIADAAIAVLYENAVMAGLVNRDYDDEFVDAVGDTITIRTPTTFQANDFPVGGTITVQDATEQSTPMTLDRFKDVSFAVSARDLTLEIDDFTSQLLEPAMEALFQQIDTDLLSLRGDVTQQTGGSADPYPWDDPRVMIEAGKILDQANVPVNPRRLVTGPISKAEYLADPLFHQADQRGGTVGLNQAQLGGRAFGFSPFMDQHIAVPEQTAGNSTTEVGVAFHRDAFSLAFRPLRPAMGAASEVRGYKGFGIRVSMDYDINRKLDVVSVDCLYGVKTLDPDKAVLIRGDDVA